MPKKAEIGVIHGRFQVLHVDHLKYLLAGCERCAHLVVGVTNPDPMRTADDAVDPERSAPANNPLTYYERQALVRAAMAGAGVPTDAFTVTPLPINSPELYKYYVPMDAVFYLSIYDDWGRRKLAMFRELGLDVDVLRDVAPEEKGLSATDVRARMRGNLSWRQLVPPGAADLLAAWNIPERLRELPE